MVSCFYGKKTSKPQSSSPLRIITTPLAFLSMSDLPKLQVKTTKKTGNNCTYFNYYPTHPCFGFNVNMLHINEVIFGRCENCCLASCSVGVVHKPLQFILMETGLTFRTVMVIADRER